jgi:tetratricopeptide (TPR) repeat protein
MQEAINLNTYQTPEIRQKLADNVISLNRPEQVKDTKQQKENFNAAFEAIKDNINDSPLDVQNKLYLMILYNTASRLDASLPNAVLRTGEEALKLSPTRPQIYFEMGQAAINLGNVKEGVGYFQNGVDLNPVNLDSRWLLLTAHIITGQNQAASDEYDQMLKLGLGENITNLERLANLYSLTKNYSALAKIYEKLVQLNPKQLDYWQKLSASYKETGQTEALNKIIPKILELNPSAIQPATTSKQK